MRRPLGPPLFFFQSRSAHPDHRSPMTDLSAKSAYGGNTACAGASQPPRPVPVHPSERINRQSCTARQCSKPHHTQNPRAGMTRSREHRRQQHCRRAGAARANQRRGTVRRRQTPISAAPPPNQCLRHMQTGAHTRRKPPVPRDQKPQTPPPATCRQTSRNCRAVGSGIITQEYCATRRQTAQRSERVRQPAALDNKNQRR